ncbi:MAG: hypothetical protein COA96_15180 [SAR86 cluster bacterium]|uniref:Uncharacterized protein n=1 Tax=SAR86 cluster bacterium TaxID=2030880 RepID=A0A2A5ARI3_9GAMM|nr:MAG: hypothetical protein COA96_15180 [SAR86 cluster bacterium]
MSYRILPSFEACKAHNALVKAQASQRLVAFGLKGDVTNKFYLLQPFFWFFNQLYVETALRA